MTQSTISEVAIDLSIASPELLKDLQAVLDEHEGSEAIRFTIKGIDEVPERIDPKFLAKVFVALDNSGNVNQKARQAYEGLLHNYLGHSHNPGCRGQRIPECLNALCPVCSGNLDGCGHDVYRVGAPKNAYESNIPSISRDALLALSYEDLRAMHATSANRMWEAIKFMRSVQELPAGE